MLESCPLKKLKLQHKKV